jgi:hypothetical protein
VTTPSSSFDWFKRLVPDSLHLNRLLRSWVLFQVHRRQHSVVGGVFKGMRYTRLGYTKRNFPYLPRVLGTFEMELEWAVNDLATRPVDKILNVGAEVGYYAVGLALRCPQARVDAFEVKDHAALNDMIRLNNVQDRVYTYGWCDLPAMNQHLQDAKRPAVFMDAEGAERELLDPAEVPALRSAFIIVELHHFMIANIRDLLWERFTPSHDIIEIHARARYEGDFPLDLGLLRRYVPVGYLHHLMFEDRPDFMRWHYMIPKKMPAPTTA